MHLSIAERDLFDFVNDKVAQYGHSLTILAIDRKLAATGVLMDGNDWTTI